MRDDLIWHQGGCHCGAVKFEVAAPSAITVHECNCSLCGMQGFLHLIVPKERFRIVKGEANLSEYRFNSRTARHLFCRHCGVKGFYVPRSNPDGWSVNLRAVDKSRFTEIKIEPFDGQNWEANAGSLAHLSQNV